jgi:hypothetical protein
MKNKTRKKIPIFQGTVIFSNHESKQSFCLLADLIFEEIMRQRTEAADSGVAKQTVTSDCQLLSKQRGRNNE